MVESFVGFPTWEIGIVKKKKVNHCNQVEMAHLEVFTFCLLCGSCLLLYYILVLPFDPTDCFSEIQSVQERFALHKVAWGWDTFFIHSCNLVNHSKNKTRLNLWFSLGLFWPTTCKHCQVCRKDECPGPHCWHVDKDVGSIPTHCFVCPQLWPAHVSPRTLSNLVDILCG